LIPPGITVAEVRGHQFLAASLGGACLSIPGAALSYIALMMRIGIPQMDNVSELSWQTQIDLLAYTGDALLLLAPAGAALAAYWTGNHYYPPDRRGSYWMTAAGSYSGAVAGIGLTAAAFYARSLPRDSSDVGTLVALVPLLVVPQLSAVLGYHLSRRRPAPQQGYQPGQFDLPNVSLELGKKHDRHAFGFNVRLLNVEF